MLKIGDKIKYRGEIFVILDITSDENLIIGKENNCENEVSKSDVILFIDDKP